jgi:glucose/arabinose dehydrogenase
MIGSRRAFGMVLTTVMVAGACTGGSGTASGPAASNRPSGATASPSPVSLTPPSIRAEVVASVEQPLGMAVRTGDPSLFIVGRRGKVWALRDGRVDPTPVLDLSGEIALRTEQGLLGMAFSPDGRFVYINYTDRAGDTNIVEYAWRDGRADVSTRRLILFVDQPFPNHNGGDLVFGPDGDLYIGMGDGGSNYRRGDPQGDPDRNGQNLQVLLGKMLRIQPRLPDGSVPPGRRGYAIPSDNPFVGQAGARPEIWAYGLRNPWRYSFDRQTGDLWIGDVGAGAYEEIDVQRSGATGGQNYGWNAVEGTLVYRGPPAGAVPPAYAYTHGGARCSITGGYVYRGAAIPELRGWYVFGDYCGGTVTTLRIGPNGALVYPASGANVQQLSSFGEDQQGELYVMSLGGEVYKLVPKKG